MQKQVPLHVLVVDDEFVNRDLVCRALDYFGHRASAVDSGQAALSTVCHTAFDVLVMDWRMPVMDGLATTRRLRAGEAGLHGIAVPVIALTAQAFEVDRDACLAAGMNDFLTKPVDLVGLDLAIKRWGRRLLAGSYVEPHHPAAEACVQPDAAQRVFDPSVLAALPMVADGSQPDYGRFLLDLYVNTLPEQLRAMQRAASQGDIQAVHLAAHSLRSSSLAVGALAMAACAAEAEAHLTLGHHDMSDLPGRFGVEYDRLCATLGRQAALTPEGLERPC